MTTLTSTFRLSRGSNFTYEKIHGKNNEARKGNQSTKTTENESQSESLEQMDVDLKEKMEY